MIDMLGSGSGALFATSSIVGVLLYVWYLAALAQLFPKLGLPASQGWIPVYNEWKLLSQTGFPGWLTLLIFLPPLGLVFVVVRTLAMHRIGQRTAAPSWLTLIGLLLPPLWATLSVPRFTSAFSVSSEPSYADHAHGVSAAHPNAADEASQSFLSDLQHRGDQNSFRAAGTAALAPAPQLFDTEAHVLPPLTAAGLAAATGSPQVSPPQSLRHGAHSGLRGAQSSVSDDLGAPIEAEYERLAREAFLAPPATDFRDTVPHQRFSWEAAVNEAPPPAPAAEQPKTESFLLPQRPPITQAIPLPRAVDEFQNPTTSDQLRDSGPVASVPVPEPDSAPIHVPVLPEESLRASLPVAADRSTKPVNHAEPQTESIPVIASVPVAPPPLHPLSTNAGSHLAPAAATNEAVDVREPVNGQFVRPSNDPGGSYDHLSAEGVTAAPEPAAVAPSLHDHFLAGSDEVTRKVTPPADFRWMLEFDSGVVVQLHPDTIIGRAPRDTGAAIAVPVADASRTLSKTHARFTFVEQLWLIEDLGSTNGVRLVQSDGSETVLQRFAPVRATQYIWLGTLRATLREGRA